MADEEPRKVGRDELQRVFSGPAIYANKMYVTGLGPIVRISFMEQLGGDVPPQFRAAILLSTTDAEALYRLLAQQIAEAVRLEVVASPDGAPMVPNGPKKA